MNNRVIASSLVNIMVILSLWQYTLPPAYAQRDDIKATLDCLEEVANEKIIAHLPALMAHIRERQRDETTGAYPPLPHEMNFDVDIADVSTHMLLLKAAQAVRYIQDSKEQEQAFALLHPLILEAWLGNVPDVSPEQALDACFEAVYYSSLPILPPESKQHDLVLEFLLNANKSEDEQIKNQSRNYLLSIGLKNMKARCRISQQLAVTDESSNWSAQEFVDYFERNSKVLGPPLSYAEYENIRRVPMDKLAQIVLDHSDYSYKSSIQRQFLTKYLIEADGDPDCDSIRLMLLSDPSFAFRNKWIIPPPVFEDEATPEQIRTRDAILTYLESIVDAAEKQTRFGWMADILPALVYSADMKPSRETPLFPTHGRYDVVRILKKIVTIGDRNSQESAIRALSTIASLEPNIALEAMDAVEDFILQLEKENPDWANQQWFIENTAPTNEQRISDDDIRVYEAAHLTLKTLRHRLGAGWPRSR